MTYKTKFQLSWMKKWPFILPASKSYSFHCKVCSKTMSCGHQGERDFIRHSDSAQHKKNVQGLKNNQTLNFGPKLQDKVILVRFLLKAEFYLLLILFIGCR